MIGQLLRQLATEIGYLLVGPVARRATRELFATLLLTFSVLLAVEAVWTRSVSPFINLTGLLVATALVGFFAVLLEARAVRTGDGEVVQFTPLSWLLAALAPAVSAAVVWGISRGQTTRPYVWALAAGIVTFLVIYLAEMRRSREQSSGSASGADNAQSPERPSPRPRPGIHARASGSGLLGLAGGLLGAGHLPVPLTRLLLRMPWTAWRVRKITASTALRTALVLVPMVGATVYGVLNIYSKPIPSSDGLTHTMEIRQVVESGRLAEYYTYLLIEATPESRVHRGIDYPNTYYVTGAFFWMLGGERAMFLLTVLSGAASMLFGYLLFRRVHPVLAGLAGAAVWLVPFSRFTQAPFMEQLLLAVMLAAVFYYVKLLEASREQKWKYAIMTGAMLGLGVALKQQGWILAAAIAVHSLATYVVTRRHSRMVSFRMLLLVAFVAVVALAVPIAEMTARNGTFLGSEFGLLPGITSHLPFMQSKYEFNAEAQKYLLENLGYGVSYASYWQVVGEFLTYPFNYGLASLTVAETTWTYLFLILMGAALIHALRSWWVIWTSLMAVLVVEVAVTKRFNDIIINYHLVGISVTALLCMLGGIGAYRWLSLGRLRPLSSLLVGVVMAFGILALVSWVERHQAQAWGDSKIWESRAIVAEYRDFEVFANELLPEDALAFGSGALFPYYGRRDTLVGTWWGGAKLLRVWKTASDAEAVEYLRPYGIQYVFFDKWQLGTPGSSDYAPADGLIKNIGSSPYFQLVYRSPQGQLALYKVLYPPVAASDLSKPLGLVQCWPDTPMVSPGEPDGWANRQQVSGDAKQILGLPSIG